MNRLQLLVLGFSVLLFAGLYFGLDRKPKKIQTAEATRALNMELLSIESYTKKAKEELDEATLTEILSLEQFLETSEATERLERLKQLSGAWYRSAHPVLAGHYAFLAAEEEDSETAWSIAGTTFSICIQRAKEQNVKDYCTQKSVQALENAKSINPEEIQHQGNIALAYVNNPPQENPMKGVLMLRELNQLHPKNVFVLLTLADLSIRTGQLDNAVKRLKQVLTLEPENSRANCTLAEVLKNLDKAEEAVVYQQKCG